MSPIINNIFSPSQVSAQVYLTQMRYYDFEVRIAYSDTDRMGVIYYANYLVFFERGRTEFLRSLGLRYRDLEEKEGIELQFA